jgi:hypothetical protein
VAYVSTVCAWEPAGSSSVGRVAASDEPADAEVDAAPGSEGPLGAGAGGSTWDRAPVSPWISTCDTNVSPGISYGF